ncbi:MAG TPA: hypothetical protein VGK29_27485 [Paludibaculum sp.]|jgi:hypothetical protein
MTKRFYIITRDLHLYVGLFFAPFILLFSISVFFLVHSWLPGGKPEPQSPRVISNLTLPPDLETLDGRARVDALQAALPLLGLAGEIGFVRHIPKKRRLEFSVSVPGRDTSVELSLADRTATVTRHETGIWDGLVALHKSPGQHLVAIRMNWWPMRVWRWFADGTVYLLFFISLSGIYLWAVLRAERAVGLVLLAAGALSFLGIVYAVIH